MAKTTDGSRWQLLIDIDGTLYDGDTAIPGAVRALERLRRDGISLLLVTNTTRMSTAELLDRLRRMRFGIRPHELFTVPAAAAAYLSGKKKQARCFVVGGPNIDTELRAARLTVIREEAPVDFVVLSQYKWISFGELDIAQRLVGNGAEPVAMHRDLTYPEGGVTRIALGAAAAALEAATGREATIIGKPNPRFFELAMAHAGFSPERTLMIGDNYASDIVGAANAELPAIQVRTGNYRAGDEVNSSALTLLDSFAELPDWLMARPPADA